MNPQITMNHQITIYTKHNCLNCDAAKQIAKQAPVLLEIKDTTQPGVLQELQGRQHGVRQMPAIFVNNQFVGGLAGLKAALAQLDI